MTLRKTMVHALFRAVLWWVCFSAGILAVHAGRYLGDILFP